MAHKVLERTDDWKLKHPAQDVRGWPIHDPAGRTVGTVDKMIIDTADEEVDTLVLESGVEVPVSNVAIGDDVVFLKSDLDDPDAVVEVYDDGGHLVEQEIVYDDATVGRFQKHHGEIYGMTGGGGYDDYDFAYRYGYDRAHHDDFSGVNYNDADADLSKGFAREYPDYRYDDYGHAVQYGYQEGYTRRNS